MLGQSSYDEQDGIVALGQGQSNDQVERYEPSHALCDPPSYHDDSVP